MRKKFLKIRHKNLLNTDISTKILYFNLYYISDILIKIKINLNKSYKNIYI